MNYETNIVTLVIISCISVLDDVESRSFTQLSFLKRERILCARSVGAPMSKINPDHTLHIQRCCVRGFCKMFFVNLYILQKPP
jgi:hypothetical protein